MKPREFWDRYLRAYDALNMLGPYANYMDEVAHRLCRRPGMFVLDAGSGTGNLSIRMHELGAKVVSLDFSAVALAIHKEKDPSATLVQTSLEEPLPFESNLFDAVACTSVLFALSPPGVCTALREFRRILKPGGRVIVTAGRKGLSKAVLAWTHFRSRLRTQQVTTVLRETWEGLSPLFRVMYYNIIVHGLRRQQRFRRFTKKELLDEIANVGLQLISCETTYAGIFHLVEAISLDSPDSSRRKYEEVKRRRLAIAATL